MEGAGCLAPPMRPPMRVIVDSHLRAPPAARALSASGDVLIATIGGDGGEGPIGAGIAREPGHLLAATTDGDAEEPIGSGIAWEPGDTLAATAGAAVRARALVEAGAEIVLLPDVGGRVSLPALMAALAGRGVNEVHTECGPTLAGALLESGLVDEIVVYLAPALLGDAARGMFTLPGVAAMRDRIRLEITGVARLGADLRIDGIPKIDVVPKIETDAEQRAGEAG